MVPDFEGFSGAVRAAAGGLAIPPILVSIVPSEASIAAFRIAVEAALAGIVVPVTVAPSVVGGVAREAAAKAPEDIDTLHGRALDENERRRVKAAEKAETEIRKARQLTAAEFDKIDDEIRASQEKIWADREALEKKAAADTKARASRDLKDIRIADKEREAIEKRGFSRRQSAALALKQVESKLEKAKQPVLGAQTEVKALERQLTSQLAVERQLGRITDKRIADFTSLQRHRGALVGDTTATIANTEAQLANARAQALTTRQREFASRGILSQGLNLLGLRGATLAANKEFIIGAASVIAFAKAVSLAADLEADLNVFRVVAGATADEMRRVSAEAERLGADITLPGVGAGDAAQAMTELSKAGLSVEDSLAGARGVLQLATAAEIDNATATKLVANALNAFGKTGDQAVHVADLLTNAANAAQGSIEDMGLSLQQASAVARQVGVSLEDTVALLTLLAKNGIRGSDAGTSLRVAFTKLINPTDRARKILTDLNVQLRDAQGNIRPEVFAEFAQAQAGLSKAQQDANAAIVFGTDALRAYSIIAREGLDSLEATRGVLAETGSAAELAGARMAGLSGSAENLKNQLAGVGTSIGQLAIPPLKIFLDLLAEGLGTVNEFTANLKEFGDFVGDLFGKARPDLFPKSDKDEKALKKIAEIGLEVTKVFATPPPITILKGVNALVDQFTAVDNSARKVGEEVRSVLADFEKFGGGNVDTNLAATVQRLTKIAERLSRGDAEAQKLAESVRGVIEQIKDPTVIRGFRFKAIKIPVELGGTESASSFVENLENKLPGSRLFGLGALVDQQVAKGIRASSEAALALGESLRKSLEDLTGVDLIPATLPADIRSQITKLSKLGPTGQAELKAMGKRLSQALADGIAESNAPVQAARQELKKVIAAADEAFRDSVQRARDNLDTLGSQLSADLADAIDAGPIGRKINTLTAQLEQLRSRASERGVQNDLRDAKKELRDARASIVTLGQITPEQQQIINEFLQPFIDKVKDAEDAAKEFKLEQAIKKQEDLRDKAKESAEKGIQVLIDKFKTGKITAAQFASQLKTKLSPAIKDLPKTNLGLSFTQKFMDNLNAIVAQAQALTGFLGVATGAKIELPGETKAEGEARIAEAKAALKDAQDARRETADNTKVIADTIKAIAKALDVKLPNTKKTNVPNRGPAPKTAPNLFGSLTGVGTGGD